MRDQSDRVSFTVEEVYGRGASEFLHREVADDEEGDFEGKDSNPSKGGRREREYSRPVPEHLKGYKVPSDIRAFIADLYPNMKHLVEYRLENHRDDADEVINNFVVYLLGTGKRGVPRYTVYDPVLYPNQPFFKWVFATLKYFVTHYWVELRKREMYLALTTDSPEQIKDTPGVMSIDMIEDEDQVDPMSYACVQELDRFLETYSTLFAQTLGFEAYAYYIFKARLSNLSGLDIAQELGISPCATSVWMKKLRTLIENFYEGEFDEGMQLALKSMA